MRISGCVRGHSQPHSPAFPRPEPLSGCRVCYHPAGGPNEAHERSSPAVKSGTRTSASAAPADRPGTGGAGEQFQRSITHDVGSRSQEDKPGAETSMGEGQGGESCAQAEAHHLISGPQAHRGGAESALGQGEEGGVDYPEPGRCCGPPGTLPEVNLLWICVRALG